MLRYQHIPYSLNFKFDAGTSRGVLRKKETHFIKLWHPENPSHYGIGETGMFRGLSADDSPDFTDKLNQFLTDYTNTDGMAGLDMAKNPSISMGMEMALLDLKNGGNRICFNSDFIEKSVPIPINGLVWMGKKEFMRTQIEEKIKQGFECVKLKIGALDFNHECELLKFIRDEYSSDIILRVDANGAIKKDEALGKLNALSKYNLHSIEQPIAKNQWEDMARLVEKSPIPIALDEELIGVSNSMDKERMLDIIKPEYIILKPSLLGGFTYSEDWIKLAAARGIGWWVTSALESNIGLNAIAQWTSQLPYTGHQGLGTGMLYSNNIQSPLTVNNGMISYDKQMVWDINLFEE